MEWGFLLKKLISMWLMPLPFSCLLIIFGLTLSYWRAQIGRLIAFAGVSLLMLASWQPFANSVLYPIEQNYRRFNIEQPVDAIVVLGNCHVVNTEIPPMAQLCGTGLYRLMEGYRIWQANPSAELLLSGYEGDEPQSYAETVGKIALDLGVPAEKIRLFPQAKDTQEEAEQTSPYLIDKSFALVTSASHMQRSMNWFEQQNNEGINLNPIAAPAHFGSPNPTVHWKLDSQALIKTERAWYEFLGRVWAALKT